MKKEKQRASQIISIIPFNPIKVYQDFFLIISSDQHIGILPLEVN
jgi:hypothetical protein